MKTLLSIYTPIKEFVLIILLVFWVWFTFIACVELFVHDNYKPIMIVLGTDFIGLLITKLFKKKKK